MDGKGPFMVNAIKYSVIIPVYNREATLSRCLDSLLCQNREDIQILVIDDGSRDGSGQIGLRYAADHECVTYIRQENAGVSAARNTGLDRAEGTYVLFVDSDDYVTEDYFSVLDAAEAREDWNVLVFGERIQSGNDADQVNWFSRLEAMTSTEERLQFLFLCRVVMQIHNKCFRNEQVQEMKLRFDEDLSCGEDFVFSVRYCVAAEKIGIASQGIYCLDIEDQNSLSRKYRKDLAAQLHIVFSRVQKAIQANRSCVDIRNDLLAIADYLYVKLAFSCVAEEFKRKNLSWFTDQKQIREICEGFRQPLCDQRCSIVHICLRLMLQWRIYLPVYLVAYAVKGRKYIRG